MYNHSSNNRLAKNALYTPAGGRASTRRFPQRIVCYSNCGGEEEKIDSRKQAKTTKPTKATLKKASIQKRTSPIKFVHLAEKSE